LGAIYFHGGATGVGRGVPTKKSLTIQRKKGVKIEIWCAKKIAGGG